MQFYPVKFKPIPTERMWGGHTMKSWFGVEHIAEPVGEYWLVSGHPTATSVVENGSFAGMTLTELTQQFPEAYLGASPQPRFPLLVKLIEASADLSVQVHPDDQYAQNNGGDFGKTEAWYILNAPATGKVVYGHQLSSRDDYIKAVEEGRVKEVLRYQEIQGGELVYVPAQTLHALLADTTLIEVQQTSDVTYRVYDWDRVDTNGQARELHIHQAADVLHYGETDIPRVPPVPLPAEPGVVREKLLQCPYFTVEKISIQSGEHCLEPHVGPSLVIGVSGQGRLCWIDDVAEGLKKGDAWLVPSAAASVTLKSGEELTILRITY